MDRTKQLKELLSKLATLRNRADLAYSVGDFNKAKEFSQEAHELAQKCQVLQFEIEEGGGDN